MIYLVSGWLRHGTSMMMVALRAGGMTVAASPKREAEAQARFGDALYRGNETYHELTGEELAAPDFPLPYEGKLVKCLRHAILRIPAHAYRIVYMRRDGEEARQSAQALFGRPLPAEWGEMVTRETERVLGILRQRRDCHVIEVPYRAVMAAPGDWFWLLRDEGWPIDPEWAAATVDPAKCRYRAEELQAGA